MVAFPGRAGRPPALSDLWSAAELPQSGRALDALLAGQPGLIAALATEPGGPILAAKPPSLPHATERFGP